MAGGCTTYVITLSCSADTLTMPVTSIRGSVINDVARPRNAKDRDAMWEKRPVAYVLQPGMPGLEKIAGHRGSITE
jgi:hypothetical protein